MTNSAPLPELSDEDRAEIERAWGARQGLGATLSQAAERVYRAGKAAGRAEMREEAAKVDVLIFDSSFCETPQQYAGAAIIAYAAAIRALK
jgi:hypothetical protein